MTVTDDAWCAAYIILSDYLKEGGNIPGINSDDVDEFVDALEKGGTIRTISAD